MKTQDLHHEVIFDASPDEVYNLLMNEELHSEFTGVEAFISVEEGGTFSVYDGYITGQNVELVPGEKIVQLWKAKEEGWPDNHFSKVSFTFTRTASGKTKMNFEHTGIPEHKAKDINTGWEAYYWEPMKEMLEAMHPDE